MKRVMCIWFPNWPIQRRLIDARSSERGPAVVVHSPGKGGKIRVHACCRAARQRGVRVGMLLVEAQSLWPASAGRRVRFEAHDPRADQEALRELALWSQQFSPTVALDDAETADGLLLDATGCGFGFEGEKGFAEKVAVTFQRRGYQAVVVIADHIGTAWAVAHYGTTGEPSRIVPPGQNAEALRPLPVEALRLSEAIVPLLRELNIVRIDQLLALPREELPCRFGAELLLAIDRALGVIAEMLDPERPADPLEACWQFEPPIADGRALTTVIEHLLERLLGQIQLEHFGVQRLLCSLKLAGHDPIRFPVELLRPSPSQRDLMELVRLQIERLRIPAEVLEVTVRAAVVLPLEFQQDEMFGGGDESNWRNEARGLLERLSSRLGERAVLCPHLRADAQPEFAYRYEPWLTRGAGESGTLPGGSRLNGAYRPVYLTNRPLPIVVVSSVPGGLPQQFLWNQQQYLVERSWGPERIETGWWRGDDVRRDYFVVESVAGERFWMFRNLADGSWHLHGVFA